MSTVPLSIFCTTVEGLGWSIRLVEKFNYEMAVFKFVAGDGFSRINKENVEDGFQLRCFITNGRPSLEENFAEFVDAFAPKIVIDIKIGGLITSQSTLVLSTFDTGQTTSSAAKSALSWLKREIKSDVQFGVIGTNQITGGATTYKGIGYTQRALDILRKGGVWRGDSAGQSTFRPAQQ